MNIPTKYVLVDTAFEQAVTILEPRARPGDEYLLSLDDDALDEAFVKIDEAERRVERLLRDALAGRQLLAWVESNGALIEAGDAELWRTEAFGRPGFQARTHHLTNPGPPGDRDVLIERNDLETWLASFMGASGEPRRRGRPPAADWGVIKTLLHEECKNRGGIPSLENGVGWKTQADAERFVSGILARRREKAKESAVREHVSAMLGDYNEGQ